MNKLMEMFYKQVVEYRRSNPKKTLQEIGDVFGVSRQRIHQILKEHGNGNKVS